MVAPAGQRMERLHLLVPSKAQQGTGFRKSWLAVRADQGILKNFLHLQPQVPN